MKTSGAASIFTPAHELLAQAGRFVSFAVVALVTLSLAVRVGRRYAVMKETARARRR